MRFGTAVHALALTPRKFGQEIVVANADRRTDAGKAFVLTRAAAGLTVISPAEYERARAVVAALHRDYDAKRLLRRGRAERVIVRKRGAGLIPLKGRLDIDDRRRETVLELKTCRSLEAIDASIRRYGYLLSAAFYQHLVGAKAVIMIFVESSPPHRVRVVPLEPWRLAEGRAAWQTALARFDACWAAGVWPDAEPVAPELDDDPLMLNFLPAAKGSTRRFDIPVGDLEL
jgi:hypothetical protein